MQQYTEYSNSAGFGFPSLLVLMSMIFQQITLGSGSGTLKELMIDHLKAGENTADKRIGLLPTPSLAHFQSVKKGESRKETPSDDRVFFPPYKFPFWGLPYGIYSKGGFFNPGLFPFVPGGPAFPPYDGIFGGPYGPGKFPGSGPTPFQGGSNSTAGAMGAYSSPPMYYQPESPPKRYRKKKYKKKCCTTTTPAPTTEAPPPDTTTTAPPDMMDYYPRGYKSRNSNYPPKYRSPPSYHYGYDSHPPPPPYYSYPPPQPQIPYPLIIQTPFVMPQAQPQYYMPPPQMPPYFSPYMSMPPIQSPYGGYPGHQPITVHNFYSPPNQPTPNSYQLQDPYMAMSYVTTTPPPSTTEVTEAPTTTTVPPTTYAPASNKTYVPLVYYVQPTPAPYQTPPVTNYIKYQDSYSHWYAPSTTPTPQYNTYYNSNSYGSPPVKRETFTAVTAYPRVKNKVNEPMKLSTSSPTILQETKAIDSFDLPQVEPFEYFTEEDTYINQTFGNTSVTPNDS